jgi:hypothetical protein
VIRKELCAVADISAGTFMTHRRNGDLPFDVDFSETYDGSKRRWARYSIHEAARLIATINLAASQGVTWSEACAIVRGPHELCGAVGIGRNAAEAPGYHLARAEHADDGNNDPERRSRFTLLEGPLPAIVEAAEGACEGYASAHPDASPIHVASLVTVDLSAAYRIADARMRVLGLEPGLDDDPRGRPDEDNAR